MKLLRMLVDPDFYVVVLMDPKFYYQVVVPTLVFALVAIQRG